MAYCFGEDREQPGTYHVWGRAKEGVWLFRDDEDRAHFEWLIDRHLSVIEHRDLRGRSYACLREQVRMCARNLLASHYHLVLWQRLAGGIAALMRRVIAAYTSYHHEKYGTSGSLFDGPYRARLIEGRKSLLWRIAYVNANHKRLGLSWRWSTHRLLLDDSPPSWIEAEKVLELFGGRAAYRSYMERYLERGVLDQDLRVDEP